MKICDSWLREWIEHGRTGFVVESIEEAVTAVRRNDRIERAACRRDVEQRFSAERMARDYLDLYASLIAGTPAEDVDPVSSLRVPEGLLPDTSQ